MQMKYSDEVRTAISENKGVVALESTIIAHGMPYPDNLDTAKEVEAIVRQVGAVPATIAVLEGNVCIGLETHQLEQLADSESKVEKLSTRDLAGALVRKGNGATTVAATMRLASLAGIRIFVTGGIGGVHRGWQETMDISADLMELSQTPVAVVCAGIKSILDMAATLEALETLEVPVAGYQTQDLPAFYSPTSGLPLPCSWNTPDEVACWLHEMNALGQRAGSLLTVPVPESEGIPQEEVEEWLEEILQEVDRLGISGSAWTPFVLSEVVRRSEWRSLKANQALIRNNARVGAEVALAYAERFRESLFWKQ